MSEKIIAATSDALVAERRDGLTKDLPPGLVYRKV